MSARNAKEKSGLPVQPATNGKSNVSVVRSDDELTLSVGNDGPTITIKNGERTHQREGAEFYQIVATVDEQGELVSWRIEKSGITAMDDTTIFITAKKRRAPRSETEQKKAHA